MFVCLSVYPFELSVRYMYSINLNPIPDKLKSIDTEQKLYYKLVPIIKNLLLRFKMICKFDSIKPI